MRKFVVLYDSDLPYEGIRPDERTLDMLRERFTVTDANGLGNALKDADTYVHLHGSYFPKDRWQDILSFTRAGKGMLVMGGAPFRHPAYRDGGAWQAEPAQTAYHRQLFIHEALRVETDHVNRLAHNPDLPLFRDREPLFAIEPTYGLVLHVTRTDDSPGQLGSSGPMDAHIYPLLRGIGGDEGSERELAAPAVLLEHTKGDFAGGRWILIPQPVGSAFWCEEGARAMADWAAYAAAGVTEMWLKPGYSAYEPGDRVTLTLQTQQIARTGSGDGAGDEGDARSGEISVDPPESRRGQWSLRIRVWKSKTSAVTKAEPGFVNPENRFTLLWSDERQIETVSELRFERFRLPFEVEAGFYAVECEVTDAMPSSGGGTRTLRQGFWGFDEMLLREGDFLTAGRDYFVKDGRPFPIVGMTYMASDVARKYLFLPNAAVWDRDMAQMKRAGINLIRTGIWTAWRQFMFVDGHAVEETMRAIDAFLLTAKRHGLEVTFNFFSFTPELWEGVNPYLDPRSVEAQKRFLSSVISRHAESKHVHWDLINEPSMFDPKRIFSGPRSAGDRFERVAYVNWLRNRHGSVRVLQERWNMTPKELPSFEAATPPEPDSISFATTESLEKKGAQWLDYSLFTMDMHNHWARQLAETIRAIQPKQLVTVGQDEGLGGHRPSPFFYAEAVDYTTVHTWWLMDDLVWDSVFGKAPDKPTLVQETGIMFVETPDGRAKRSERELRNILERKYAYAFATGGAGAVQWIWNINFYMHNVNESHIGALRADGTEKPETSVSYDFGAFIGDIRDLFQERSLEEVALVYPYSNDFSNRPLAGEATARAVRTFEYVLKVPVRGLGEFHLDSLAGDSPKLTIVPSAHNFSDNALRRLIDHVKEKGGVLLITGPVGLDEYWRPSRRLEEELGAGEVVNLLREEILNISSERWPASFGGPRIADSNKQLVVDASIAGENVLVEAAIGKGTLLWCPLPLELNQDTATLAALYRYTLDRAGVKPKLEWLAGGEMRGVFGHKVHFGRGSLFVFVSEYGADADISVRDSATGKVYSFRLESERSVLFAADAEGRLLSVYRPSEVAVTVR